MKLQIVDFKGKYKEEVMIAVNMIAEADDRPDLPEEIETALSKELAFLLWSDGDGFAVLLPQEHQGEIAVNLMLAYSTGTNCVPKYLPSIEHLAKKINARYIIGYAKRKKVLRICQSVGFEYKGINRNGLYFFTKFLG
ncbi:MAG: hypothetical protein ACTH6O_00500 [Vibrio toranzoniae]